MTKSTGGHRKALIPAAGFGRRSGSPPAKELLLNPNTGLTLIETAISTAKEWDLDPVVISRRDKTALNEFLSTCGINPFLINHSKEWTDTLIQARSAWGQENLVLLPDVDFSPKSIGPLLLRKAERGPAFATFSVEDFGSWGTLSQGETQVWVGEKPKTPPPGKETFAWGLFAFHKNHGEILNLIQTAGDTGQWIPVPLPITTEPLQWFKDFTR